MDIVYLNGEFVRPEDARVPVMDRGFLFGDGVYEVIPAYGGRLFRLEQHLRRLDDSLRGIRMDNPLQHAQWEQALTTLLPESAGSDYSVYLQVTRGVGPRRDHGIPPDIRPTTFAMAYPAIPPTRDQIARGVAAITLPDIRWQLCNIKAITLLGNVLLKQQAADAGAAEAILIRDGYAYEGAATNIFVVSGGTLITPPDGPMLLPGVTRDLIVELAQRHAIPLRLAPLRAADLASADELWLSSSTKEVLAVTELDAHPVGSGVPGPVWSRVRTLFRDYKAALRDGRAS